MMQKDSSLGRVAQSLRFLFINQNVIAKLLYCLRNIPKKVIGLICRNDIYQGDDAVVLIEILVCPGKNQLLGFGVRVPGCLSPRRRCTVGGQARFRGSFLPASGARSSVPPLTRKYRYNPWRSVALNKNKSEARTRGPQSYRLGWSGPADILQS